MSDQALYELVIGAWLAFDAFGLIFFATIWLLCVTGNVPED